MFHRDKIGIYIFIIFLFVKCKDQELFNYNINICTVTVPGYIEYSSISLKFLRKVSHLPISQVKAVNN